MRGSAVGAHWGGQGATTPKAQGLAEGGGPGQGEARGDPGAKGSRTTRRV